MYNSDFSTVNYGEVYWMISAVKNNLIKTCFVHSISGEITCAPITSVETKSIDIPKELYIYPNPANDLITIEGAHIISYSLVNLAGKELASGQTNGNITSVNISHIESGAYFIKVRETDDFTIRKITIAR